MSIEEGLNREVAGELAATAVFVEASRIGIGANLARSHPSEMQTMLCPLASAI